MTHPGAACHNTDMTVSFLAYFHVVAILTMTVFISSQAALCRPEWLNAAAIHRLVVVNRIYLVGLLLVILSGLARMAWGGKGMAWIGSNGVFHVKMVLFSIMVFMAIGPTRTFKQWHQQASSSQILPSAEAINRTRKHIMRAAHIMLLIPVFGVLLVQGWRW